MSVSAIAREAMNDANNEVRENWERNNGSLSEGADKNVEPEKASRSGDFDDLFSPRSMPLLITK